MSSPQLKITAKEIFYIPNILTYLRLLLLPLIYLYLVKENLLAVGLLSLLAISTDILDGVLARKLNQVSNLGKILDPVVDKITIGIFAIYAMLHKDFPIWAAGFVILKDVLILLVGLLTLSKIKVIPVSDLWGKLTALMWALCILSYILNLNLVKEIILVTALILSAISWFRYFNKFRARFKKTPNHW